MPMLYAVALLLLARYFRQRLEAAWDEVDHPMQINSRYFEYAFLSTHK